MASAMIESHVRSLDDSLVVRWADGTRNELPYLWLRDNCDCDQCRVTQTTEKLFMISDVAADLSPLRTDVDGNVLKIVWPDGHTTKYEGPDIRALCAASEESPEHWGSEFEPERFDYRSFLDDEATARTAMAEFLKTGAILLSAAPIVPDSLESLAPRLGPVREVVFARIHDVEVDPSGYNIAHTSLAVPPHNDFASYTWPPSVQALHMLANEVKQGNSIIVDGFRILESLRHDCPDLFDELCKMPVPFRQFDADYETHATAPIIDCDTDGQVVALRFSNQLMQMIPPNRPGLVDFYRAYHELCRRVSDRDGHARFRLAAGTILIVAGHRVLHAREGFEATGRRHLQDAYFEHDNVRNHLFILERRRVSPS